MTIIPVFTLLIASGTLAGSTDPATKTSPREAIDQLFSLGGLSVPAEATTAEPEQDEDSRWSGKVDFGLTLLAGNTESTNSALNAELSFDEEVYQWLFTANYAGVRTRNEATGDTETTTRLMALGSQYNRYLDDEKNFYFYGKAAARENVPIGLDLRWDAGVGAGYTWYFSDDEKTLFSIEGGPSYVHEENVGSPETDAANARAGLRFETPLFTEWMLTSLGEYFVSLDETDDQSFTGEVNLDWAFRPGWYFKFTAAVAWDNTPAAGFESTDRRFVVSVGHSF